MVNGRRTRNLPGRKTNMADSQWGATLHIHCLLRFGFVPPPDIRRLKDYRITLGCLQFTLSQRFLLT